MEGENTLASYYGRLIYNFADRYYVTAMIRRDGSSRFGPNSKWGNFPAVSFAWRIANEEFMPKSEFLSDLKLRIGYGKVGNQDITQLCLWRFVIVDPKYGIGNYLYS